MRSTVCTIIAGSMLCAAMAAECAAETRLHMSSEPGDWIGQGRSYEYTSQTSTVSGRAFQGYGAAMMRVQGAQPVDYWHLDFASSPGTRMGPGSYMNVDRMAFRRPNRPGLDIGGQGRGCNTLGGYFILNEIMYQGSRVVALDATFSQHCCSPDGSPCDYNPALPEISGRLQYHAGETTTPGDMNCDGIVNNFDIDPFLQALSDQTIFTIEGCFVGNADVNGDFAIDNFDIDAFVEAISGK